MIQKRICRECGHDFDGGPRAYYCPSCRIERKRKTNRDFQTRKKAGHHRPIGSIDLCMQCGKEYTVNSGLQQYCPQCAPEHNREYDRVTSIAYYTDHKDSINPVRNARRRIGPVTCRWCGQEFDAQGTCRKYCSKRCKQNAFNKLWMIRYYPKRLKRKKLE